jgi:eukaryotic-like serine/threonine-protein kinase
VSSPARDLSGELLIGKLRVIQRLGAGGMGAVYEVEHTLTKHRRAMKVLHANVVKDAATVDRFLREAAVAGTLGSPYVVDTYDAGQLDDGSPYVLMELLSGQSLAALLKSRGRLAIAEVAAIGVGLCRGLTALHRAGIVHRDIKPENVFLARDRDGALVKLLDFGISKFTNDLTGATQSGAIIGTPYYISPEQMQDSKRVDVRTDLYSTGVTLYELASGARPFEAETFPMLVMKVVRGDHLPLDARSVDPAFARVVERAMCVNAAERFATADELAAALAPFVTGELVPLLDGVEPAPAVPQVDLGLLSTVDSGQGGSTPAVTPVERIVPRASSRLFLIALALVLVGLASALVIALASSDGGSPERTSEEAPGPVRVSPIAMTETAEPAIEVAPEAPMVIATEPEPAMEEPPRRTERPSERAGLETMLRSMR